MSDVVVLNSSTDAVVIGTSTSVQVASTDTSAPGPPGPAGPAGDVAKSLTRAAMAGETTGANLTRQLIEAGREGIFVFSTANLSASVTADPGQGIYVAPTSDTTGASGAWVRRFSGAANVKWFGATLDGTTDDTTAAQRALDLQPLIHIPAGTLTVSTVSVPANTTITTDGFDTIVKQKSGTGPNIRIVNIVGSGVTIGDIAIEGQLNQGGDTTGEQNAAIFVYSSAGAIERISIGNVRATNIRGDAVMVGGGANAVRQVSIGHIYANNCYRNGLTVYNNVQGLEVASIYEVACGQHVLDIEPDSADPVRGIRIGHVRGRYVQFSGASTLVQGVEIGSMDMDPANGANSTPANAYAHGGDCISIRGSLVRIGHLKANGYNSQVVQPVAAGISTAQLHIGLAEITSCCLTEVVNNSFFQGGLVEYRIDRIKATTTLATHRVFNGCANSHIGKAEVALLTGSSYMRSSDDCTTRELVMTVSGGGAGGDALVGCTRCFVGGGTITGNTLDGFGSTRCVFQNIEATLAAGPFVSSVDCFVITSRVNGSNYLLSNLVNTLWRMDGVFATPNYVEADNLRVAGGLVIAATSPVVTQSGTSYTAVLGDAAKYIRFTNASPVTFTIPPNASVAFPIGTEIDGIQAGAGALTIAPGAGVTLNSSGADLVLAGQYSAFTAKKVATNEWDVVGKF